MFHMIQETLLQNVLPVAGVEGEVTVQYRHITEKVTKAFLQYVISSIIKFKLH